MKYHIKNEAFRASTDLTLYRNQISTAVKSIFPNAIVSVHPKYFEINNIQAPTNTDLQKMGKAIVNHCPQLNTKKINYGYSTQLFVRI